MERRVEPFLEELHRLAKAEDPDGLFGYANACSNSEKKIWAELGRRTGSKSSALSKNCCQRVGDPGRYVASGVQRPKSMAL
jgi:hypothetical protein